MGVESGEDAAADGDAAQADRAGNASDGAGDGTDRDDATDPDGDPTGPDGTALAERLDAETVVFVDALNDEVGRIVESSPELRFDYVVGDVSGGSMSSNGHLHFDLVHGDSTIHCVIFAYRLDTIDPDVEDGLQVAVTGDLSYYEDGGNVSVIVEDVVELGEGVYERTYRKNRALLEDDGLLADDAKQPLPEHPRTIGIATSAGSDAREDAVTSIHGRHPDLDVVVRNASVQGERAMASLMQAISELDDDARIDVIVVTRGGGADKHLRVFNETPLCRVVANTDTPIVVGVGHERDRTLAAAVADRRIMTPTEVGEIVPEKAALEERVATLGERLDGAYGRTVSERIRSLESDLDVAYDRRVRVALREHRTDLEHAFETVAAERLTTLEGRLDHALAQCEQRVAHERETADVAAIERSRRRQRLAIAGLAVLVLLLLAYIAL